MPRPSNDGLWKRRWKIVLPLMIAIASLVSILAWGLLNQSSPTGQSGAEVVGEIAPNFTMTAFSGDSFNLSDYTGSPVIINFWASWCSPCRVEAPALEKTWRTLRNSNVMVIGINVQDVHYNALDFLEEFDITYPNGTDEQGIISIDYGVGAIPVTFLIDELGVVVRRFVGAINEMTLDDWIIDLSESSSSLSNTQMWHPDVLFEVEK